VGEVAGVGVTLEELRSGLRIQRVREAECARVLAGCLTVRTQGARPSARGRRVAKDGFRIAGRLRVVCKAGRVGPAGGRFFQGGGGPAGRERPLPAPPPACVGGGRRPGRARWWGVVAGGGPPRRCNASRRRGS